MKKPGFFARLKSLWDMRAEGTWRGPFYGRGELGGIFGLDRLEDGWQRNLSVRESAGVPIAYACVMANARGLSLCWPTHHEIDTNGRHRVLRDSWVARLFRNPNAYETWPQFMLNVVAEMLFTGESAALIVEDNRFVPVALHRIGQGAWTPYIDPESKEIFYGVANHGNPAIPGDLEMMIPARRIIHFRAHTPRHPLIGESPISAAALALGINVSLAKSQEAFFTRMRRPSGILSTDLELRPEQLRQLRDAFDEQAKLWNSGGMPILASGLKFQPLSISSQDSELIQAQRMSIEDVCRVFGVPPPIVADLSHATLQNAEQLAHHWLAIGLGSLIENVERSLDKAFRLPADQYIELDTTALLRTDFVARIEGLSKAVQGGIMAPNEAREREGLSPVEGGDMAFLQAQMTPINLLQQLAAASVATRLQPEPEPAPAEPEPEPEEPEEPEVDTETAKILYLHQIRKAIAA